VSIAKVNVHRYAAYISRMENDEIISSTSMTVAPVQVDTQLSQSFCLLRIIQQEVQEIRKELLSFTLRFN